MAHANTFPWRSQTPFFFHESPWNETPPTIFNFVSLTSHYSLYPITHCFALLSLSLSNTHNRQYTHLSLSLSAKWHNHLSSQFWNPKVMHPIPRCIVARELSQHCHWELVALLAHPGQRSIVQKLLFGSGNIYLKRNWVRTRCQFLVQFRSRDWQTKWKIQCWYKKTFAISRT